MAVFTIIPWSSPFFISLSCKGFPALWKATVFSSAFTDSDWTHAGQLLQRNIEPFPWFQKYHALRICLPTFSASGSFI